jgi:hypothetical protein
LASAFKLSNGFSYETPFQLDGTGVSPFPNIHVHIAAPSLGGDTSLQVEVRLLSSSHFRISAAFRVVKH